MRKFIIVILVALITCQFSNAQEETFNEVLSFHPFHLVNNGIRIDYDRQISKNHWIQVCPQFYAFERNETDIRDFDELLGLGFSVYHRIYVGNKKPTLGTYFSYGFTLNHYNLKYDEDYSTPYKPAETTINKFGGDIVIGYQLKAFEKLIIDMYAGLGGRYSERSFKGESHKKFNEFLYDYGYTGNVLVTGIRIGFCF